MAPVLSGYPSVAKIFPATRKSGWFICERSSVSGKARAILRKSLAVTSSFSGLLRCVRSAQSAWRLRKVTSISRTALQRSSSGAVVDSAMERPERRFARAGQSCPGTQRPRSAHSLPAISSMAWPVPMMGAVVYSAQATPRRSSSSRVPEHGVHGLKGDAMETDQPCGNRAIICQ